MASEVSLIRVSFDRVPREVSSFPNPHIYINKVVTWSLWLTDCDWIMKKRERKHMQMLTKNKKYKLTRDKFENNEKVTK